MWYLVILAAVVAVARLTIWRRLPTECPDKVDVTGRKLMTVALFAVAGTYAVQVPTWADWLDETPVTPANISDLLHAVIGGFACCVFGVLCLRWRKNRLHVRIWVVYCLAIVAAEVVASGFGARPLPGSTVYQGLTALIALSVGAVLLYSTRHKRVLPMVTVWVTALAALASAVVTVVLLAESSESVIDRYDTQLAAFSVPILVATSVAGIRGLVKTWRKRWRDSKAQRPG
jgi:hypothetical protein